MAYAEKRDLYDTIANLSGCTRHEAKSFVMRAAYDREATLEVAKDGQWGATVFCVDGKVRIETKEGWAELEV